MSIQLHISPKIIKSIATLYNDPNRIFMEYIDNSLDSAEKYFEPTKNEYSRHINIKLKIAGGNYKQGTVIIEDNCSGISNIRKLVESIGDSDKKAQSWTNGEFGYGIYSFMAACEKLEVITRQKGDTKAKYLPIDRKQFDVKRQEDVKFPDPKDVNEFVSGTGTKVKLSKFDKAVWKNIDVGVLKQEIEKHFELMLGRGKLKISLINSKDEEMICETFDYERYNGDKYEDGIKELSITKGRKNIKTIKFKYDPPRKIYIKVTDGKTINKNPIFVSKGRRIAEIKDVKSFRSDHKNDLWGHPNVTGYIDVTEILEPTIARNDFRSTTADQANALFDHLKEIEPLIMPILDSINRQSENRHYKELEDRLNETLSDLAKADGIAFRTDYLQGDKLNLENNSFGQNVGGKSGKKDTGNDNNVEDQGKGFGGGDGNGAGRGAEKGVIPERKGIQENQTYKEGSGTELNGKVINRSGFNIRIVDSEPPIDSTSEEKQRSLLVGNEIRIYRQHEDFKSRIVDGRTKDKRSTGKVTPRLATYLASEITIHYKDKFYSREGQPMYNVGMFKGVVDFIYKFEESLSELIGKNLADLQ